MSARAIVLDEFAIVAKQQQKTLAVLTNNLELVNSGLDSLCFAIIVARLEDRLGIDPFSTEGSVDFPITFGDFVALYEDVGSPA